MAARFAAKEATIKAIGTNIDGIAWKDVEVVRQGTRPPTISLHGNAHKSVKDLGIYDMALSLSHCRKYAVASVVGSRHSAK